MWATFVIFKKLPKVNNHPKGKNSLNLVTLAPYRCFHLRVAMSTVMPKNCF
jgi:hypothetical protein